LSFLLIGICIPQGCAQQDDLISECEASLQSWLTYAESYVGEDGQITSSFMAQNSFRGTALLGQLVIGIHIGLVDSPSLLLLNRIANYLNTHISQYTLDLTSSSVTNDDVLMMGAVTDFLVGHYALTNSAQSRENLLQVADYLTQQLGWSPLNSRFFILTNVLRIEQLTGGSILKQDVEEAISDLLDHQLEFIDFSLLDPINFPISLNVLSVLYGAALQAQVSVPSEVIALWQVYCNYTLTDLSIIPSTPTYYSSNLQYLSSLVEALDVSRDPQTLHAAQTLAVDLLSIWQSGDRLIRQPFSPFEVYPYDPALNYSQIIQDAQNGVIVWKIDLKLASLVDRLAVNSQSNASLAKEFRSRNNFALNQVVQGDYFSLFDVGTLPTEGFVDRIESAALISEWLARRRLQEQVPSELLAFEPLNVPVSLIAAVVVLITVGLLYNRGVLFSRKEDD
jgi:hypothetical protein